MASKFFGGLMIVAGVFIVFAGGCFLVLAGPLFGEAWFGLLSVAVGAVLIALGVKLIRAQGESDG